VPTVTAFGSRSAGGAWIVGAGLLALVTVVFLPVAPLTVPWALAMTFVGVQLLRKGYGRRRIMLSMGLAVISLLIVATFRDQDITPYVIAPAVAGISSAVAAAASATDHSSLDATSHS
jgi:hypothetical protein